MITVKNIKKTFDLGKIKVEALKGVNLDIKEGEFVAIMGASGSGKSTLLHMLALLDHPTDGEMIIAGEKVLDLSDYQKTMFRLENYGYVFQDYAILPELTSLENVYLPALTKGVSANKCKESAMKLLEEVGMADRAHHLPSELSGGQQQRVSIARSLINRPKILFADEPCANLDSTSSKQVLELFKKVNKDFNQTIVMVTHESWHKKYADRVIWLKDGKLEKKR